MRPTLLALALLPLAAHSAPPIPAPPWPAGDERGMANAIGNATWARCAPYLANAKAKSYEISQVRSNTMPKSPFAGPYAIKAKPTTVLPFTAHAFNSETFNEGNEYGQEGTQFDALGHFAFLKAPWDGKGTAPADDATYYGGFTHIENAKLDTMARDKVYTACTMILPLLEKGGAGSALRPVAIGMPGR